MKKRILYLFLAVTFMFSFVAFENGQFAKVNASETKIIIEGKTGNYDTIQAAIDAAAPNDTVLVPAGTYREIIEVDKEGLTLKGVNSGVVGAENRTASSKILFPENITNRLAQHLIAVSADNVTIDGFDVINIAETQDGNSGGKSTFYSFKNKNLKLINNFIDSNVDQVAVQISGSEGISKKAGLGGVVVENNYFRSISGWSTLVIYGIGATVENNTIIGGSRGIQLQVVNDSVGGVVKNNKISAYNTAIYHNYANVGSAKWTYKGNTLTRTPVTNSFRGTETAPDYKDWTGFFVETFGAEKYAIAELPDKSPELAFENNIVDGNAGLSREGFKDIVGIQFKGTIIANPAISIHDNSFKNVSVAALNRAKHKKSEQDLPMFSLEMQADSVVNNTNTFDRFTSVNEDKTRIDLHGFIVDFKNYDGTVVKSTLVESGQDAVPPANPAKPGHTFTGWDVEYTNVSKDLTTTAVYKINTYKVVFKNYDGTVLGEQEVAYLKSATAPKAPTRLGYSFVGWDKAFDEVTAALEVKALYKQDSYVNTDTNGPQNVVVGNLDGAIEIAEGAHLRLDIATLTKEAVPAEDLKILESYYKNTLKSEDLLTYYLDFSMFEVLEDSEKNLTTLNKPITISFDLPKEFYGENFKLVKVHDGKIEVLEYKMDKAGKVITFSTDSFSTYALISAEEDSNLPKTGSNHNNIVFATIIAAAVALILVGIRKVRISH